MKKILIVFSALIASLFVFAACGETGNPTADVNGTYYFYASGETDETQFITLENGTWRDDDGATGTYKISGSAISFYSKETGDEELYGGTYSDGVLTLSVFGEQTVYRKDGKKPNGSNGSGSETSAQLTVTYNANGGNFRDGNPTLEVKANENSTLIAPDSPVRDNYAFTGWATDKNGKNMWKFATDKITGNVTLYAVWGQESAVILSVDGASIEGTKVFMSVSNETESVSLSNKIICSEDSVWKLYYDKLGQTEIPTKIAAGSFGELDIGDNVFYVVVSSQNGAKVNVYDLTIRRRPVYSVIFDANGGVPTDGQFVEEDDFATAPVTTRAGYDFTGWNYDFEKPIKKDTTITAAWKAHTDTPYKAEYYLENPEDDNYTLTETVNKAGTTDTEASAEIKTYEHYTPTSKTVSGNINGDGSTVLKVYYTLDRFTVNISANNSNVSLNKTYSGPCKYGSHIEPQAVFNNYLGYEWKGWYDGNELITTDYNIPAFSVDKNINYVATCDLKEEMLNFAFTSTDTTCQITGIKNKTVTEIIVPDYVTEISQGTFSGCSSLKSITIPFVGAKAGVTSSDTYQYPFGYIFGTDSYSGGTGTKQSYDSNGTYYIPSSLRSVTATGGNILKRAFYNCSGLTSVTIGNGVTSIGYEAFRGCSGLTGVTIGNGVTSIGGDAFYNCSGLTSVTIGNGVTSIGEMAFSGCSGLTSITIPDSVTSIGNSAFYNCSGLTSIIIPDSVTSIGYSAFNGCSGLTSVTIGNSVTSIGERTFYNCSGLTSVTIGNGVTSIGNSAFEGCSGLTSVTIGNGVTSIGNSAFEGCSGLTSVTIGNGVTSIGYEAFYNCSGLTSVTIGNGVTSIGTSAFNGCIGLTSVIIPDGVTTIEAATFADCIGLTSVTIPDSVTSIGNNAFNECRIKYITCPLSAISYIPKTRLITVNLTSGTTIGEKAFYECSTLSNITIPDSITSIGNYAFYGCSRLTSVTIPDSVTSIGDYAFRSCSGLTSITIPDGITSIGERTFEGCRGLTSITIPDGVTSIGNDAFANCSGLTGITLPFGITNIEDYTFSNCSGLTSITIPDSVTSIGDHAFYGCSGLTSITIPDGVTSIGGYAFYNCSGLTSITFKGTKAQWQAISKGQEWKNNVPSSCLVHCTDGDLSI